MSQTERLFENFPPVTTEEWMDKIKADLKGEDFAKKLIWRTNEGFEVKPFYRSNDLVNLNAGLKVSGKGNNWRIRQDITVKQPEKDNRKALEILMKGVDSLGFVFTDPSNVTRANIGSLLKEIHPESIELSFGVPGKAKELVEYFSGVLDEKRTDPSSVRGTVEADPLGRLLLNGKLCISFAAGLDYLADLTKMTGSLPLFRTIRIGGSHFTNAGADVVQELAFSLAMGSEYMSELTKRGIDPGIAASKTGFSFGIGSNYFFEIAKLRAARLLWQLVTEGYGLSGSAEARMDIHCVTSEWNKTVYDPYVNLLRTQTEAMSAALGGADSITVEPFDKIFRQPDEFSERLARNQQLLLKEEAYFDKVADPSAGAYYIENLTSMIAEKAWELFIETEEKGGFVSALKEGFIQKKVKESAARRTGDISKRKEILLGTNQFPAFKEKAESIPSDLNRNGKDSEATEIEPLHLFRGAVEIEKLRLVADSAASKPSAFMLTIGNPAMRMARSQFSCNFFACGGYNVIDNPGFKTTADGIKAAVESKAELVVVCSSDEEYPVFVPEIAEKLKGKAIVIVAGNPPSADELRSKGIEHFISIRSDLVETISRFHRLTGLIK